MRTVSTLTAIGTALWLAASSVHAVGFGRVSNSTQLGQPLNFSAAVRLEPDEVLPVECVAAEVQSGENRLAPGQVRISIEGAADASNRTVRVTTSSLIDEPVVTVSVTLGCTSQLTRRFVAFIDPPLINAAQTAPVDAPMASRAESQGAAIVSAVPRSVAVPGTSTDRPAAPRNRVRAAAPLIASRAPPAARDSAAPQAARPRAVAPSRQPGVAGAAAPGPRLQLEAAAPVVARTASSVAPVLAPAVVVAAAAAPTSAAAAISAATPAVPVEPLAQERERIQVLEDGLGKLLKRSQSTEASMLALQVRLKEAEAERYQNPLVYALAALLALLALVIVGQWWRQTRGGRSAQWWSGPAVAPVAAAAAAEPVVSALSAPPKRSEPTAAAVIAAAAFEEPTFVKEARPVLPQVAPRELSVEELIDLKQQAEFFIVLGQDEAAIELLMSHVRTDGSNSPLPYLKLLEIYRRRDEGEAYQRIRDRFNRRFNAYAPDWGADLQEGRSLVDYPETLTRLQGLWSTPVQVMQTLDASLFRRDHSDASFDLPAYRELLLLYAVARDLAESAGVSPSAGVDVLLPLDEADAEPVARLSAAPRSDDARRHEMMTLPIKLNLPPDPAAPDAETAPPAASRIVDFDLDLPAAPPPKSAASER